MRSNPLSPADWTLIGPFVLPSQDVTAAGVAQAMLIDVRNGYPYGQITASIDGESQSALFHTGEAKAALARKVEDAAVVKLTDEAFGMMGTLKTRLAAK